MWSYYLIVKININVFKRLHWQNIQLTLCGIQSKVVQQLLSILLLLCIWFTDISIYIYSICNYYMGTRDAYDFLYDKCVTTYPIYYTTYNYNTNYNNNKIITMIKTKFQLTNFKIILPCTMCNTWDSPMYV